VWVPPARAGLPVCGARRVCGIRWREHNLRDGLELGVAVLLSQYVKVLDVLTHYGGVLLRALGGGPRLWLFRRGGLLR